MLPHERRRSALVCAVWALSLLGWLGVAHQLEFRARRVFTPLWLMSLAFFAANALVVHEAVRLHSSTPCFRAGRIAAQACLYGGAARAPPHADARGRGAASRARNKDL